jgi:uncharacterized paraquat-inducible protein A
MAVGVALSPVILLLGISTLRNSRAANGLAILFLLAILSILFLLGLVGAIEVETDEFAAEDHESELGGLGLACLLGTVLLMFAMAQSAWLWKRPAEPLQNCPHCQKTIALSTTICPRCMAHWTSATDEEIETTRHLRDDT